MQYVFLYALAMSRFKAEGLLGHMTRRASRLRFSFLPTLQSTGLQVGVGNSCNGQ